MGKNQWGQLGGEQQSVPDQNSSNEDENLVFGPHMIFSLLNTKVTDIHCGDFHNVVVGSPRGSNPVGSANVGPHGLSGYSASSLSGF